MEGENLNHSVLCRYLNKYQFFFTSSRHFKTFNVVDRSVITIQQSAVK